MTLLDICEPIFRRICELNRAGRNGEPGPEYPALRREIMGMLETARNQMMANPELDRFWGDVEMPLLFFIDSMIAESRLPIAAAWNQQRLAYDYQELAGDQKFFDLMEQALRDPGADASTKLGFFYTCIGLGFTGYYGDNPEPLRAKMIEMLQRVDPGLRAERQNKLCPEAYAGVDTRELLTPKPISARTLFLFFLLLCVVLLAVAGLLYQNSSAPLRQDLREIKKHKIPENATPTPPPPGTVTTTVAPLPAPSPAASPTASPEATPDPATPVPSP